MSEDDWAPYFTAVAGAGGAIFALLFLGMQVRLSTWQGSLLRTYAVFIALVELAVPVLLSLIVLMPGPTWTLGAIVTGGVGLVCAALHVPVLVAVRFSRRRRNDAGNNPSRVDMARIIVGTVGSVSLFVWLLLSSHHSNLESVAWISLWFLVLGLAESFVFLGHWTR